MKLIKLKHDAESDEHYFDIKDFEDIIDINEVTHYEMEVRDDESVEVKFFKQILPKKKDE